MASNTATYSFLLPTVGGDTNLWGGYLNSNWEDLDDLLDGTSPVSGIDINGGSIDGTPIGSSSASTGLFTTLGTSDTLTAGAQVNVSYAEPIIRLEDTGSTGYSFIQADGAVTLISVDGGDELADSALGIGIDGVEVARFVPSGFNTPIGTTGERPSTPSTGTFRYNSTTGNLEVYNGTSWTSVSGIPSGAIQPFAMDSVPAGWLECDGDAVSRTTYADLFAAIGTDYGSGDGSTTFNIPDFRGAFIRGWDHGAGTDPDASSRADRGDGTTGDNVGTKQADKIESHNHDAKASTNSQNVSNPALGYPAAQIYRGGSNTKISGGIGDDFITNTGGNETRPFNINAMICIKT